jgi:hypothetical protein
MSPLTVAAMSECEFVAWSRRHTQVFTATVALLALFPWTVAHWPSQDGQNHLAVAYALMHYADPGSPFPHYVSIQPGLRPSTAFYEILRLAGRFMPLPAAEKLLVSVALTLLPVSLLLFVRRALPRRAVNVMLGLPFVMGWAFAMGFLSFQFGLAFGVATLALGWEPRRDETMMRQLGFRHVAASAVYFVCVFFHPVAALIAGLALVLLEWRNILRPSEWLRLFVIVSPGALFLVSAYLAATIPPSTSALPVETSFADPLSVLGATVDYNLSYSPLELGPRLVALAILLPFAYRAIRSSPPGGSSASAAIGRLFLALLLLYCVTPFTLRGWSYASTRFFLVAWLLLPAVAEIPARLARRLLIIGPALTVLLMAIQWPFIRRASRQMQDILDVGASLAPGSKLIPMDFTVSLLGPHPVAHAWAELVVNREVVASQLFAAGKPGMGGERFRELTFLPGLLDIETGNLPWSSEGWNEVSRKCADARSPTRWFVMAVPGTCKELLAAGKASLEAVIERYNYVLMLEPPAYGRNLIAPHLRLVSHVGSAWMYAVSHSQT